MSPAPENHLIQRLPPAARASLLARCTQVPLVLSAVLHEVGAPLGHVHFPLQGYVSLVARIEGEGPHGLEVGMVGREGLVGVEAALGPTRAPLRALVQGAGTARRIGVAAFRRELARSAALRDLVFRFVGVTLAQRATGAACQRFHPIAPRLARWLLMSQDRAQATHFHVTHEFLASMLGVRRVGVTTAAVALQRAGLIHYHRGEVAVVDRRGLEALACSCYAADRRCHDELMRGGAAAAPGA